MISQSERELSDLRQSTEELKIESKAKDAQLLEQRTTIEELKTALHHEKSVCQIHSILTPIGFQQVHELTVENKTLALEKSTEVSKLKDALKATQSDCKNSVERVRHLEGLLMKLTEDSTPDGEVSEAIEAAPDHLSSKPPLSFPDPPSMDEPSTEASTTMSPKAPQTTDHDNNGIKGQFPELSQGQEQDFKVEWPVEHLSDGVESPEHTDQVKQSWKWGVSGIWSYVTGDNA